MMRSSSCVIFMIVRFSRFAEFNGFDVIDQFQPTALRYQLDHMGFALGIAQGSCVPSFTGYLAEAQNNLIQKSLLKHVSDYWVYRCSGSSRPF